LALGFSVLGLLIVAKEHDGAALIASGILGILLGMAFLVAGCLHWKWFKQIQGKIQVEEVPKMPIVGRAIYNVNAAMIKNLRNRQQASKDS
jgi:hypothetical protein